MTLPCSNCGKSLDVPTIRNMASLTVVSSPPVAAAKTGRPSILLGLIAAASLIVGLATLAYGATMAWEQYQMTSEITKQNVDLSNTEEDFYQQMRTLRLEAPPADTWDYWNMLVEEGLGTPDPPEFFKIKRYLDARKPWIKGYLTTAAISLGIFAIASILMQKFRR
ncbi:MAG: hypothetical protein ABL921_13575 [Pirellula sp.]